MQMQGTVQTAYNGDRLQTSKDGPKVKHTFLLANDPNKYTISWQPPGSICPVQPGQLISFEYDTAPGQNGQTYFNVKGTPTVTGAAAQTPVGHAQTPTPQPYQTPTQQSVPQQALAGRRDPLYGYEAPPTPTQGGKIFGATVGMALNNAVALVVAGKIPIEGIAQQAYDLAKIAQALEAGRKPNGHAPQQSAPPQQPVPAQPQYQQPSALPVGDFDDDIPFN